MALNNPRMSQKSPAPTRSAGVAQAVRTARTAARTHQFVAAATRIMERHGFHEMSMQELAREAGVSVGLAYQYFKCKEDVLYAVILDILDSYTREIPSAMSRYNDPVERLAAGFESYCTVVDSRRAATVLAYRESKTLDRPARRRIKDLELATTGLLADAVRSGQTAGIFRRVDPMLVAYDLTIFAHMWALKHWHFGDAIALESYIAQQFEFVLTAIMVPAHQDRYRRYFTLPRERRRRGPPAQ